MTASTKSLLTAALFTAILTPQLSEAAFVEYSGSQTLYDGREVTMSLEIDSDFHDSGVWMPPEEVIGGNVLSTLSLGYFNLGDYSFSEDGNTFSGTGGRMVISWLAFPDKYEIYNDYTYLDSDETPTGHFRDSNAHFADGNGNPYDWSSWENGNFALPPEIDFVYLDLHPFGGSSDLHLYPTPVPLPAAAWLFIPGLMGLFGFARKNYRPFV